MQRVAELCYDGPGPPLWRSGKGGVRVDLRSAFIQAIGFVGVLCFFASYQVRSNKGLFVLQTLGCLAFCLQFALLGAYSGCLSLAITIIRNAMLTRYRDSGLVRWKGWAAMFSALCLASALAAWNGPASLLPAAGVSAGTIACWTNNARTIRVVNLTLGCPCALAYDVLVGSWAGVLNEGLTMAAILVSIVRFGWSALDGDAVKK